jgi:hypothetical protein
MEFSSGKKMTEKVTNSAPRAVFALLKTSTTDKNNGITKRNKGIVD